MRYVCGTIVTWENDHQCTKFRGRVWHLGRVWHFVCLEGIQNESDFFIQYVVRPNGHSGDQVPKVIYVKKKKKKKKHDISSIQF